MVFLGFAAGLPFLLVFSTLSAWLRDVGIDLTTIGFFSWVGITYSIKVLWAPVIDRLPLPALTRLLGKRRSWMLVAQITIATGLAGMALTDPHASLTSHRPVCPAGCIRFCNPGHHHRRLPHRSGRINTCKGAMAATYVLGYRIALLVAGAGAFYIAEAHSWSGHLSCDGSIDGGWHA